MNSVLDDSRILCLANGQRIRLGGHMRILFEVADLHHASPATVSRVGMVYMSPDDLQWQSLVQTWVDEVWRGKLTQKAIKAEKDGKISVDEEDKIFTEDQILSLYNMFDKYLDEFMHKGRIGIQEPIGTVDAQIVRSCCNIFDSLMSEDYGFDPTWSEESANKYMTLAFILAIAWSFGANCYDRDQLRIDNLIKKKFTSVFFPSDTVFNLKIDTVDIKFKTWGDV